MRAYDGGKTMDNPFKPVKPLEYTTTRMCCPECHSKSDRTVWLLNICDFVGGKKKPLESWYCDNCGCNWLITCHGERGTEVKIIGQDSSVEHAGVP